MAPQKYWKCKKASVPISERRKILRDTGDTKYFPCKRPQQDSGGAPHNTKHIFLFIQHTLEEIQFLQSVMWAEFSIPGLSPGEWGEFGIVWRLLVLHITFTWGKTAEELYEVLRHLKSHGAGVKLKKKCKYKFLQCKKEVGRGPKVVRWDDRCQGGQKTTSFPAPRDKEARESFIGPL